MFWLRALSTSLAYFSSVIVVLFGLRKRCKNSLGHAVIFSVSAMIITMVRLGKRIEASAKRRAAAGVAAIYALALETAVFYDVRDAFSCHTEVPMSVLRVWDVLRLISRDNIPTDGEVIGGSSTVD